MPNSQSVVQGGLTQASAQASAAAPTVTLSASPTSTSSSQSAVQGGPMKASAQASQAAPTVSHSASPTSMPNGQSAVQGGLTQASAQANQAAPTVTHSASPTSMPNSQSVVQGGLVQASAQASQAAPTATHSASPTSMPNGQSAVQGGPMKASAQASEAAPTVTLSASRTSIWYPESTKLTWTSANATACSGTGKGFSPSGTSGSIVLVPITTTHYRITCTGAGGSASQSVKVEMSGAPTLAIGMTVKATGSLSLYVWSTPSSGTSAIGVEALGNQGVVIDGPVSANFLTWWKVAFNNDLTGWTFQSGPTYPSGLAAVSPMAPTLSFSADPVGVALGASSTLSWSSTKATSCSGVGFSPSGVSGSRSVSPTVSTTYKITCTGNGGSTTRTTPVIVNPAPDFTWNRSLPVTFHASGIVRLGGTETRALVFMDGSLYAGIGDWEDPQLENAQTPGAQVLRLDSPTGSWVEDEDFNHGIPYDTSQKNYEAVSILGTAHFDHDSDKNPITPVDVLMAGFWSMGNGLTIFEKTVKTGSVGAHGTWTQVFLEAPPKGNGQVRSFSVLH
jgi:hypothetical protein